MCILRLISQQHRTFRGLATVILLMLCSSPLFSQLRLFIDTLDATNFPLIRAKIHVREGNLTVRGLTISNFTIQEDGIIQAPIAGYCEDTVQAEPVSVLLVMDRSGSMGPLYGNAIIDAKRSAKSFVDKLSANDECALISFSDYAAYDQSWTSNKTLLKNSIDALKVGNGTALWDAIVTGVQYLQPRTKKKAMIVLTDGDDNSSRFATYQSARTALINSNIVVYTIGLGNQLNPQPLKDIAAATKGKYYEAKVGADLDEIYALISQEISSTGICELRYTSKLDCLDSSRHTVRITVSVNGDNEYAEEAFTLPYNPATFSFVTLAMGTDYVVEQGQHIVVPVELTNVSTNRPPRSFQFDIHYDRTVLALDSVGRSDLTKSFTLTHQPTAGGSSITLRGNTAISTTGLLLDCYFTAAHMEQSSKAVISVSPPDVQQFCTHASSIDGLITISGSCERAVTRANSSPGLQTRILPNVPNPFNPTTRIAYVVGKEAPVLLKLYDAIGREMQTLVHEELLPGEYQLMFDGSALSNGLYYLELTVGTDKAVRQIMLLK